MENARKSNWKRRQIEKIGTVQTKINNRLNKCSSQFNFYRTKTIIFVMFSVKMYVKQSTVGGLEVQNPPFANGPGYRNPI